MAAMLGLTFAPFQAWPYGESVELGATRLTVIPTPGHTPGGVLSVRTERHLFCGDTLFAGGVGAPIFPAAAWPTCGAASCGSTPCRVIRPRCPATARRPPFRRNAGATYVREVEDP